MFDGLPDPWEIGGYTMKRISPIVFVLTIGAAVISIAAPAAADTSTCQGVGKTMVCAQGNLREGGQSTRIQSTGASNAPVPAPASGGCQDSYGAYRTVTIPRPLLS